MKIICSNCDTVIEENNDLICPKCKCEIFILNDYENEGVEEVENCLSDFINRIGIEEKPKKKNNFNFKNVTTTKTHIRSIKDVLNDDVINLNIIDKKDKKTKKNIRQIIIPQQLTDSWNKEGIDLDNHGMFFNHNHDLSLCKYEDGINTTYRIIMVKK